jgi:hypothetical protein
MNNLRSSISKGEFEDIALDSEHLRQVICMSVNKDLIGKRFWISKTNQK